jgi:hypothetical protein
MRAVVAILVAGCGGSNEPTPSTDSGETSTATTATETTPTEPASGSPFLDAVGTIDGNPATFACRDGDTYTFFATQQAVSATEFLVGGACNGTEEGGAYSVNIGVQTDGPIEGTSCLPTVFGIQVVDLSSGLFYNCALDGTIDYLLAVDEWEIEADGAILWGGSFLVQGNGTFLDVDLEGTFRFRSPPAP